VWLLSPKEGPDADHPVRRLLPPGCRPADKTGRLLKSWLLDHGLEPAVAQELRPLIYNAWVPELAAKAFPDGAPDAILERLSLLGHVGVDLAETFGVPLIVEVNAPLTGEARSFRSLQLAELAKEIERRVLLRADAVLAVSAPLAEGLAGRGVPADRLHVIPNGVDMSQFEHVPPSDVTRTRLGLGEAFVVGFAGSLKPWHGVHVLLEAFGRLHEAAPSVRLLIVGTGPAEADLRRVTAELQLQQAVIFTGGVSHDRVPALLRAMDVAVAPFREVQDFYFSPIKLFEYMASGTCVVASRLGQIAEVIEDGVNGLLCAPDDARALADKLIQAQRSPELRCRLGASAAETVRARYTWTHAGQRTAQVTQEVVQARSAAVGAPAGPSGDGPLQSQG
jgi:glycosyltransferase involved in cell wall biosynthesis